MAMDIVIPTVGESVSSGVISKWLKPDGAYEWDEDQGAWKLGNARGRRHPELGGAETRTRRQNDLAGLDVLARPADLLPRGQRGGHEQIVSVLPGLLNSQDGVRAGGNHRAGRDRRRLARADLAFVGTARA